MPGDDHLPASIRLLARIIHVVVPFLLRLWIGSCRLTVLNRDIEREWFQARRPLVAAMWHQTLAYAAWRFYRMNSVVMVSRSRDGELATAVMTGSGHRVVRGSSSRGGSDALREMIDEVRAGRMGAMIVDGPRGPAREAKIGVVMTARDSGRPILPFAVRMADAWYARSWDRTAIPKPFSRVIVKYGAPIAVPADASRERCEEIRVQVERAITGMERELEALG